MQAVCPNQLQVVDVETQKSSDAFMCKFWRKFPKLVVQLRFTGVPQERINKQHKESDDLEPQLTLLLDPLKHKSSSFSTIDSTAIAWNSSLDRFQLPSIDVLWLINRGDTPRPPTNRYGITSTIRASTKIIDSAKKLFEPRNGSKIMVLVRRPNSWSA